jgi:hypothetical protein
MDVGTILMRSLIKGIGTGAPNTKIPLDILNAIEVFLLMM